MNFARCVCERNNLRLDASNKAGPSSALLLSLIRSDRCAIVQATGASNRTSNWLVSENTQRVEKKGRKSHP